MSALDNLDAFASESEPWFRESLKLLVEQKTISPGKTSNEDIVAGVQVAKDFLERSGAEVKVIETGGTPSLLSRFGHPEPKARVVVYNHYDVQPADAELWDKDDPFAFEAVEDAERGFLYLGRGTTDDKGPALCALRAAMGAVKEGLPIEIQCLWETEEEIGSPNFGDVLQKEKAALSVDGIIVSDTIWPNASVPAVSTGLRGGAQAQLSLRVGEKNTHSGLTGGVSRNPLRELMALATAIDNAAFWKEGVEPISPEEAESFMRSEFDPAYFKSAHGLDKLESEVPLEMMLNLWLRPTFEVHGLRGGYVGPGIKSIVPNEGELKVSFRLVPNQRAEQVLGDLRAFVAQVAPDVEVTGGAAFPPYKASASGSIHEAIMEGMEGAFGRKPVTVREGGSIGAVPMMEAALGVPVYFLPLSLPEHGYHAPNERFDWKQAHGGIRAFSRVFEKLAREGV